MSEGHFPLLVSSRSSLRVFLSNYHFRKFVLKNASNSGELLAGFASTGKEP